MDGLAVDPGERQAERTRLQVAADRGARAALPGRGNGLMTEGAGTGALEASCFTRPEASQGGALPPSDLAWGTPTPTPRTLEGTSRLSCGYGATEAADSVGQGRAPLGMQGEASDGPSL